MEIYIFIIFVLVRVRKVINSMKIIEPKTWGNIKLCVELIVHKPARQVWQALDDVDPTIQLYVPTVLTYSDKSKQRDTITYWSLLIYIADNILHINRGTDIVRLIEKKMYADKRYHRINMQ